MKRAGLFAAVFIVLSPIIVLGVDKTASINTSLQPGIFPTLQPGMSMEEVRKICPDMTIRQGAPNETAGFTLPDTVWAGSIKLLFIDGRLALVTYEIRKKKLPEVIEAAKRVYGEKAGGDGVATTLFSINGLSLRIAGDVEDGTGTVTFVDPEAMEKMGKQQR